MSFDLQLTNRRALVTGGTKGVGAAVVEVLREAGARVVTTARLLPTQPADGVRYVAADLRRARVMAALGSSGARVAAQLSCPGARPSRAKWTIAKYSPSLA
jgi:NAD(P)-dependent dehydrogenase (short-subunit alcohol dehydrogenase family)